MGYYGKGNSLTGVDTLDNYRLPNAHGYAQVADVGAPVLKLHGDVENRGRQEESLTHAKSDFDAMIQGCRDDMAAFVAAEKGDSTAFMNQVNADLHYATHSAEDALDIAIAAAEGAFADSNDERKAWMAELTATRVAAFREVINAEKAKVDAWFGDQSEWAEKLYDSYYKRHIIDTLALKASQSHDALDARMATTEQDAADANATLWDLLDSETAGNSAFNAQTAAAQRSFNGDLEAATAAAAAAINAQFDDTVDYSKFGNGSDTLKYAGADGQYLDLGYQGHNGQDSGLPHLSGYGYGGVGGVDYLYSGDHTGLAYG